MTSSLVAIQSLFVAVAALEFVSLQQTITSGAKSKNCAKWFVTAWLAYTIASTGLYFLIAIFQGSRLGDFKGTMLYLVWAWIVFNAIGNICFIVASELYQRQEVTTLTNSILLRVISGFMIFYTLLSPVIMFVMAIGYDA